MDETLLKDKNLDKLIEIYKSLDKNDVDVLITIAELIKEKNFQSLYQHMGKRNLKKLIDTGIIISNNLETDIDLEYFDAVDFDEEKEKISAKTLNKSLILNVKEVSTNYKGLHSNEIYSLSFKDSEEFLNDPKIHGIGLKYIYHINNGGKKSNFKYELNDVLYTMLHQHLHFVQKVDSKAKDTFDKLEKFLKKLQKIHDLNVFKTMQELYKFRIKKNIEEYNLRKKIDESQNSRMSDYSLIQKYLDLYNFDAESFKPFLNEFEKESEILNKIKIKSKLDAKLEDKIIGLIGMYMSYCEVDTYYKVKSKMYPAYEEFIHVLSEGVCIYHNWMSDKPMGNTDQILMLSPILTYIENIRRGLKRYEKIYKNSISYRYKENRFYQKLFVYWLYEQILEIGEKPVPNVSRIIKKLEKFASKYYQIIDYEFNPLDYSERSIRHHIDKINEIKAKEDY